MEEGEHHRELLLEGHVGARQAVPLRDRTHLLEQDAALFPLLECVKHAQSSSLERAFGCKSCLLTRITTPVGKLCFVNMHSMLIWGSNRD